MTTTERTVDVMSKSVRDAVVDQLRACHSSEEILQFESWFNSKANSGPLYEIICDFLRNRSISRGLAAKWLGTILKDRENKIRN